MNKLFIFTILSILFVGCNNEIVESTKDYLTGKPIQIKTNIAKLIESRVGGNDKEADLDKFSLFIDGGTDGTNYYAMMVQEESGWNSYDPSSRLETTYTPLSMIWANSNPVKVTAYYCGGEIFNYMSSNSIMKTVLEYQATPENFKKSDQLYMHSKEITPNEDGCITIDFKHLLSKITVSIKTNSTETEKPIQNLYINGTASSRLYTPQTNAWGDIEEENIKEITACFDSYENGTAIYEAILIPQEIEAHKFKITIEIADNAYQWNLQEAITFEEGKQYTFELKLEKKDENQKVISLSPINISTWETTTNITGSILY